MTRGSFSTFLLHLHPRFIPEASAKIGFTWCLGGLAIWMFAIEVVSGALLMLYYVPAPAGAYLSIQEITYVAPYGFFIRNIHYWAGQVMVGLVVLHMIRVFITGSFAPPRQWNWVIGLSLLVGTLVVDFTGYLLVWDDRSLWAWTIARNVADSAPVVGPLVASLLFGSPEVGATLLVRLYAWHVFLLPGIMGLFMVWHFWRIRKDGGISAPL